MRHRSAALLLALAVTAPCFGAEGDRAAAPLRGAGTPPAAIVMHAGVPGVAYLGQPLHEFIARFPAAATSPFAGQNDVVRLQVPKEGISALAMGLTPATMTIESIGFNFSGVYEGVQAGSRRTAEGIGPGSNVNDILGAYGRPVETAPEGRRGTLSPQPAAPDRNAPVRYLYRSADATVATYFVVEGSLVARVAMSRPAAVERWILKRGAAGPAAPGSAPSATPPAAPPAGAPPPGRAPAQPAPGDAPRDPASPPDETTPTADPERARRAGLS